MDLGTGDGRFVYRAAEKNPNKFYIGIDANAKALEKISMKATRKPNKGGLPNILFLQAAVENLPEQLNGVAEELHIHFPWGSLLRAVAVGETAILSGLRRICARLRDLFLMGLKNCRIRRLLTTGLSGRGMA